jgi:hypothetical protein
MVTLHAIRFQDAFEFFSVSSACPTTQKNERPALEFSHTANNSFCDLKIPSKL